MKGIEPSCPLWFKVAKHCIGMDRERTAPTLAGTRGLMVKRIAQGFTISVRYFGRSAIIFAFISASAALSGLGGGVVRVATGTPTARKNSSCPAGEQMQSNRAGFWEAFVKKCGALAGMLIVSPARTTDFCRERWLQFHLRGW
jgi:hypothetical protein